MTGYNNYKMNEILNKMCYCICHCYCLFYVAPGPVPVPPEVSMNDITATSVILRWDPPPNPNGVITAYRVNLVVLTEVDMMNSRKKRQTVSSVNIACIPVGVDRNIDVNPPMTSLLVNDLGEVFMDTQCLVCFMHVYIFVPSSFHSIPVSCYGLKRSWAQKLFLS